MAQIKKNIVTQGMSGMLGDTLVFRVKDGKTIVATAPQPTEKEPTESQKRQRTRFQEAVLYAKNALLDETQKGLYSEKAESLEGQSAYNVAVADFMHAPDIQEIDLDGYTGQVNDTILVKVTDDFKVQKVTIGIYNQDSSLVEEGEAELQANGVSWLYTATAENADINGDKIVIRAYDIPGNVTEEEKSPGAVN